MGEGVDPVIASDQAESARMVMPPMFAALETAPIAGHRYKQTTRVT